MKILVGLGNYSMADDGIGLRLIEAIAERRLDRDFEAVEIAHEAVRLLGYFREGVERILLVDAVRMGGPPGSYRIFAPEEVVSGKVLSGVTTHESDVLRVIELARQLGQPVPPLRILGIEPERMEPVMELSATLQARFEEYLAVVLEAIHRTDWMPPARRTSRH